MRKSFHIFIVSLLVSVASVCFAQGDGSLQWTFNTGGPIISSPSVAPDGTIYVGSQSKRLFAINPDGSSKWIFPTGFLVNTDWFEASAAVADDGTVYAGNYDGKLYALNPDGTKKWEFDTGAYILSSAAIGSDGTIYFGAGDGSLHALNPDGSSKWEFPTGDWVDSSPAIGADGTIYVGSWDSSIYAVNPDGTLKWSVATEDSIQSSPAIGPDGMIYIGSGDGKLWAVQPDGSVAWTFLTDDSVDGHPVVGPTGIIYFGSADGKFYALGSNGDPAWPAPYDAGQGIFGGATIRSDGSILFGASDSRIHALNADGTLKWRYATQFIVDSTPGIGVDGTILVGSFDRLLYALHGNGSGLAQAPWPRFRADGMNQGRYAETSEPTAPEVVIQPTSQTVEFGQSVTFVVEATGSLPLAFQWMKDGVEITGVTQTSLVIAQATLADAGGYSVEVSNSGGSTQSATAFLMVNPAVAPSLVAEPRPLVVGTGARLSLWVEADGSDPKTYQWKKDGADVAGATAAFFEVGSAAAGDAGAYTAIVTNAAGSVTSQPASVSVVVAVDAVLVNLSTRAFVGSGEEGTLIPGFITAGSGSRRLLMRAVGPGLESVAPGIAAISNPTLTIFAGGNAVLTNDDWGTAVNVEAIRSTSEIVGAFPLLEGSLDAAAMVDFAPGGFTVQVSGVGDVTGIGLVEIYDAGPTGAGDGRLINLSTRANAGPGDLVMIPGFVVEGSTAKTLLIRAVGPTLDRFGVTGFMADPILRIFEESDEILVNDDWGDAPNVDALISATQAIGAFDLDTDSADAAVLVVLMPGAYTAQASSVDGGSGNVLVEVYEVQ